MDLNGTFRSETSDESEAIDVLHFANNIAEATVAYPTLLSISERRANGARLIVPGFSILGSNLKNVKWPETTSCPALKESRNEIKVRNPSCRSSNHDKQKCLDILVKLPHILPEQAVVNPQPVKIKCSAKRDAPRLVNALTHLRHDYLLRDKSLTREELDNKEHNLFWRHAARACNNCSIKELGVNLCPDNEIFRDLTFTRSGFQMNKGLMLDKHDDVKRLLIKR